MRMFLAAVSDTVALGWVKLKKVLLVIYLKYV